MIVKLVFVILVFFFFFFAIRAVFLETLLAKLWNSHSHWKVKRKRKSFLKKRLFEYAKASKFPSN